MPNFFSRKLYYYALLLTGLYCIATTSAAAQSEPPANKNLTINVNWSVEQAMVLSRAQPRYPDEAKSKHISGAVALEVLIDPEGNVKSLQAVNGPKELYSAAINCVQQWKFKPYLLNGKAIHVRTEIPIYFLLTK